MKNHIFTLFAASTDRSNLECRQPMKTLRPFITAAAVLAGLGMNVLPASAACTHAPAGLVGWWKAEINAADTLGNHNGSLQGGLGFGPGKVGRAFQFDGADDYVDFGNWFDLQTFSIAMWVKAAASQQTYADIIDNNHTDSRSWVLQYNNTGLEFQWGVAQRGAIEFSFTPDTWQFLVITMDSNYVSRVYLDGIEKGSFTGAGPIPYDGSQFLRLSRWGGGGRHFNGQIDEFDIYNRALSHSEVLALMAAGSDGKCPPLPNLNAGSVAWGDYDNDGRLDLLLTGDSSAGRVSQLWHNDGNGNFTQLPVPGLPRVSPGSVAWGDYDNDGRLDFLLTGHTVTFPQEAVSQLWHNSGSSTFTQVPIPGLSGFDLGSVAWGDYDNDGRLDFLFTGSGPSQLWHNCGNGNFIHVPVSGLPSARDGSVAWGDYDNDGWLDFLLTGYGPVSQLWHNSGSGTFTQVPISGLPPVGNSSVAWGDYDNDGQLDFLLTGDSGSAPVSQLWHNSGSGTFTQVPVSGLPGVAGGSVAWADYDNDGRLDFLLTGNTTNNIVYPKPVSQLWHNNGNGTFSNTTSVAAPGLPGVVYSSVAWGDYDKPPLA